MLFGGITTVPRPTTGSLIPDDMVNTEFKSSLASYIEEEQRSREKKWHDSKVIEVRDRVQDISFNELIDDDDLVTQFRKSKFGEMVSIIESTTKILHSLKISEETYHLPFVDFRSGVRVICVDTTDESQMKIDVDALEQNVPFSHTLTTGMYRKVIIYSDSLDYSRKRFAATVKALVKIVARDYFDERRVINLAGNYKLMYITDTAYIREFEEMNSPYPFGKPSTHQIGIVAIRAPNERTRKMNVRDMLEMMSKSTSKTQDMKKNNLYMVASARYIALPDAKTNQITYYLTEYTETTSAIVKDGLRFVVGAILKEHLTRYPGMMFQVIYELDISCLPSPSVEILYDKDKLYAIDVQKFGYIKRPSVRSIQEDNFRQDVRLFVTGSLISRFDSELRSSGFDVTNAFQRERFIESLGYIKCFIGKIKKFVIDYGWLMDVMSDTEVMTMPHTDLNSFFSNSGTFGDNNFGENWLLMAMMLGNMS